MISPDTRNSLVSINELRPTQMSLGFREVEVKRKNWKTKRRNAAAHEVDPLVVPVVIGPGRALYLIDRHHLAYALIHEGEERVIAKHLADLSHLPPDAFWQAMSQMGWCRPYDEHGRLRDFRDMPLRLKDLKDDPYRSLAGEVRRSRGYSKHKAPFSEFSWADYLRKKVPLDEVHNNFFASVSLAVGLAKAPEAAHLPGWRSRAETSDTQKLSDGTGSVHQEELSKFS